MSQKNVEVVSASVAAYNAADIDAQMATYLPTAVAIMNPNRERTLPDFGDGIEGRAEIRRIEGRAEIRRSLLDQAQSWRGRYEASEIRALSHGRVLCRGRWGGVGVATGIELYVDTTVLFSLRDGLIERVEFFDDHSEALKAACLEEENVEVVRQHMEAWQRDDLDPWLATMDPTVEWHAAVERLVEGTESVYRGHEGMRRLWGFWRSEVEDFAIEAQELRDVGDDGVVLLGRIRWRGLASGIATESPIGMVITVRGGKIIRSMDYLTHEEALEPVGLSE